MNKLLPVLLASLLLLGGNTGCSSRMDTQGEQDRLRIEAIRNSWDKEPGYEELLSSRIRQLNADKFGENLDESQRVD